MGTRLRAAWPRGRALLGAATLAAAVLASPAAAAAAAASAPERALQLHDEARTLYGAGQYEEAIARLEEAVRLDPTAKVLFYNLGMMEEKTGRHAAALRHYRRCRQLETDPREREQLDRIISRVEGAQRNEPRDKPADAAPRQAAPQAPTSGSDAGGGVSPWVWVSGATAVSALAIGIGLAARAAALHPGGDATTGADTSVDDLENDAAEAHSMAIGADIAIGLAAAATAATVVLALTLPGAGNAGPATAGQKPGRRRPARTSLRLEVGPARGRLVWQF